ncbi:hypothetical protein HMPREF3145_09640 [Corynebacterium sp. HMSC05C01]|uniref:ABC transporter permease n=1 Tax=unclassified Corynebacterium TaxID=2624378 RepID=UPI0008A2ABDB|nr:MULTISPECIES: ABC transporter permease [unclassified Corynebacterium]OFT68377.1 hypothetical protein HMPREF3145_09640 [Corynebacterium sp. HMSC05C01]OHO80691.1 hypothetical protein HMPREF2736_07845 [Corynebacterium sp. HMSC036E10]
MDLILNDLLKFRRSHVWAVAFLVPVVAVAIGAGNYAANTGTLTAGWGSYFSQVMLFYGLLFCTAGIAILAAAAWRVEHRGHNWLTMLTSTRSVGNLVASKIAAIAVTVAAMHAVLIGLTLFVGWALGIPGAVPGELLVAALLALAPAVAVASWQSLLSMVIRSFAAPIGIAVVVSLVSFGALAAGVPGVRFIVAPALLSHTLWLGSSAVAAAGALGTGTVTGVLAASAALTVAGWAVAVAYLRRTDARI